MMVAPWLEEARSFLGLKEVSGKNDHPLLTEGWATFGLRWLMGQPWCGLYVGHCLRKSGVSLPKNFFRAKAFLDWGERLATPVLGCVVVFDRKGGGHVGFVVGKDSRGRLMVLGGNQNNMVSIAPFEPARVAGYRWPPNSTVPAARALPTIDSNGVSSTNEA